MQELTLKITSESQTDLLLTSLKKHMAELENLRSSRSQNMKAYEKWTDLINQTKDLSEQIIAQV